jgi:hypothetical protein
MRNWALIALMFAAPAYAEGLSELEQQAAEWFSNDYGARWADAARIRPEDLPKYYLTDARVHLPGGALVTFDNTVDYWREFIESIGPEWTGSSLEHLKVEALNATTVSIRSQWISRHSDGTTITSCDGYIADRAPNGWVFTNYLFVNCDELQPLWK